MALATTQTTKQNDLLSQTTSMETAEPPLSSPLAAEPVSPPVLINSKLARNKAIPAIDTNLMPSKESHISISPPNSRQQVDTISPQPSATKTPRTVSSYVARKSLSLPYTTAHTPSQNTNNHINNHQDLLHSLKLSSSPTIHTLIRRAESENGSPIRVSRHNRAHTYTPNTQLANSVPTRLNSANSSPGVFCHRSSLLSQTYDGTRVNISDDDWDDFLYGYARGQFDPCSIPPKPRRLSSRKSNNGSVKYSLPASPVSEITSFSDDWDSDYIDQWRKSGGVSTGPGIDMPTMIEEPDVPQEDLGYCEEEEAADDCDNESYEDVQEEGEDDDMYLAPPMPPNEGERRRALWRFQILNTSQDVNFTRIVGLVKEYFKVPISLISLVNTNNQWFKAENGLGCSGTAREVSFCGHAILQETGEPFVVPDALIDWRFKKNPLVTGSPHIRFYAGAPLRTKDGHSIGTVCLIDTNPRDDFSANDREALKDFARVVVRELELWADRLRLQIRNKMQQSIAEFSKYCLEGMKSQLADQATTPQRRETAWSKGHDDHSDGDPVMQKCFDMAIKLIQDTLEVDALYLLEMRSLSSRPGIPTDDLLLNGPPPEPGTKHLKILASYGLTSPTDSLSPTLTSFFTHLMQTHEQGYIFQNALPSALPPENMQSGIIVPIYDNSQNAFGFVVALTKDSLRQFEDEERVYLGNFGVNVVSEILKRRVVVADRAKSIFISSMSHELRTPLHGILASCELMEESKLTDTQKELLKTIQSCGISLISILNSVLDFAKLDSEDGRSAHNLQSSHQTSSENIQDSNESVDDQNSQQAENQPQINVSPKPQCLKQTIDLVTVLEEVAESCTIGQQMLCSVYGNKVGTSPEINNTSDTGFQLRRRILDLLQPYQKNVVGIGNGERNVAVMIDVEAREAGWKVVAEDGSIRQILMNIIGNALKFTLKGHVHVSLATVPLPNSDDLPGTPPRLSVLFTVTDTGRGISPNFLKTRLFQPFSQEDSLQAGTGLGLSIVKLLVEKMGGRLDVESEVGKGTRVRIWLDLDVANDGNSCNDRDFQEKAEILSDLQNKVVAIHGFKGKFREIMGNYWKSWYGIKNIVFEDQPRKLQGDLIIINHDLSALKRVLFDSQKSHKKSSSSISEAGVEHSQPPIIFIAKISNYTEVGEHIEGLRQDRKVVVISAPVGPRKLERTMLACFKVDQDEQIHTAITENWEMVPSQIIMSPVVESSGNRFPFSPSPAVTPSAVITTSDPFNNTTLPTTTSIDKNTQNLNLPSQPPLTTMPLHNGVPTSTKTFPTSQTTDPIHSPEMSTPAKVEPRVPRVLIVEDNAVNRKILATFLKKRDVQFEEAENGAIGVEKFRKGLEDDLKTNKETRSGFDLVLMDIQMPVMNGNVATAEIRKIEKEFFERNTKSIAVRLGQSLSKVSSKVHAIASPSSSPSKSSTLSTIFSPLLSSNNNPTKSDSQTLSIQNRALIFALTGLASDEDKNVAYESGVDGFLTKPVSLKMLERVLDQWSKRNSFEEGKTDENGDAPATETEGICYVVG